MVRPYSHHEQSVFPTEDTHHATDGSCDLTPEDHQQAANGSQDRREREEGLRPNIEESKVQQIQSHGYLEASAEGCKVINHWWNTPSGKA